MDNFIVIVFIYIKGRKESVILMIKPTLRCTYLGKVLVSKYHRASLMKLCGICSQVLSSSTHSKVWKTEESNYVALTRANWNFFINDEVPFCPGKWTNDRIKREVHRYVSVDRESLGPSSCDMWICGYVVCYIFNVLIISN